MIKNTNKLIGLSLLSLVALTGCSHSSSNDKTGSTANATNNTNSTTGVTGNNNSQPTTNVTKNLNIPSSAQPAKIEIDSIKVNKKVENLGLNNGEINPPQGTVQWYNATPSPVQKGNSVIAAHVTYNNIPDVFQNLDKMKNNDIIKITYNNGSSKSFKVVREKEVNKQQLRYDASVWGAASDANLILVTCDAASKVIGHHHVDNFVVWAKPITTK